MCGTRPAITNCELNKGYGNAWTYLILTKFREYLISRNVKRHAYFASIKFCDFERKFELECIKFRDFFLVFDT